MSRIDPYDYVDQRIETSLLTCAGSARPDWRTADPSKAIEHVRRAAPPKVKPEARS